MKLRKLKKLDYHLVKKKKLFKFFSVVQTFLNFRVTTKSLKSSIKYK